MWQEGRKGERESDREREKIRQTDRDRDEQTVYYMYTIHIYVYKMYCIVYSVYTLSYNICVLVVNICAKLVRVDLLCCRRRCCKCTCAFYTCWYFTKHSDGWRTEMCVCVCGAYISVCFFCSFLFFAVALRLPSTRNNRKLSDFVLAHNHVVIVIVCILFYTHELIPCEWPKHTPYRECALIWSMEMSNINNNKWMQK